MSGNVPSLSNDDEPLQPVIKSSFGQITGMQSTSATDARPGGECSTAFGLDRVPSRLCASGRCAFCWAQHGFAGLPACACGCSRIFGATKVRGARSPRRSSASASIEWEIDGAILTIASGTDTANCEHGGPLGGSQRAPRTNVSAWAQHGFAGSLSRAL